VKPLPKFKQDLGGTDLREVAARTDRLARFVLTPMPCLKSIPSNPHGAPCRSLLWFDTEVGLWQCANCGHKRQALTQEREFFQGKAPRLFSLTELLADYHACLALAEDLMGRGEPWEEIEAVLYAMKVSEKERGRIFAALRTHKAERCKEK